MFYSGDQSENPNIINESGYYNYLIQTESFKIPQWPEKDYKEQKLIPVSNSLKNCSESKLRWSKTVAGIKITNLSFFHIRYEQNGIKSNIRLLYQNFSEKQAFSFVKMVFAKTFSIKNKIFSTKNLGIEP